MVNEMFQRTQLDQIHYLNKKQIKSSNRDFRKKCRKCGTEMEYSYKDGTWICKKCGNGFYEDSDKVQRRSEREAEKCM